MEKREGDTHRDTQTQRHDRRRHRQRQRTAEGSIAPSPLASNQTDSVFRQHHFAFSPASFICKRPGHCPNFTLPRQAFSQWRLTHSVMSHLLFHISIFWMAHIDLLYFPQGIRLELFVVCPSGRRQSRALHRWVRRYILYTLSLVVLKGHQQENPFGSHLKQDMLMLAFPAACLLFPRRPGHVQPLALRGDQPAQGWPELGRLEFRCQRWDGTRETLAQYATTMKALDQASAQKKTGATFSISSLFTPSSDFHC